MADYNPALWIWDEPHLDHWVQTEDGRVHHFLITEAWRRGHKTRGKGGWQVAFYFDGQLQGWIDVA